MLAQRLRDAFGEAAILARLGEDEFAVLTQRGFPRISERMRTAIERPISVAGFDIHPTFSMGAVSIEGGDQALESAEILRRARVGGRGRQVQGRRRRRLLSPRSGKRRTEPPWRSKRNCARPLSAAKSMPGTSRSSTCIPAASAASRPWRAGFTRSAASSHPIISSAPRVTSA
ncbi:MAG: diguanylate cyclase [Asticcacaulis sp.]